MMPQLTAGLAQIAPILIVVIAGCLAMLLSVARAKEDSSPLPGSSFLVVSLAALVGAFAVLWSQGPSATGAWGNLLAFDNFSVVGQALILLATAVSLCIGAAYMDEHKIVRGEYYALTLFCAAGMLLMVAATELLTFFIGLETMSLAIYVLVGFRRADRWSQEAALKYFISGSFASAFFLFGAGLLFGASGSTDYVTIASLLHNGQVASPMFLAGAVLCLVGFTFKIAAVPFHMWAPDAYMGAPTSITGFMAVTVKTAAFVALVRFGIMALGNGSTGLLPVLVKVLEVIAILTMTIGNLLALLQRQIKRLLAYSSIAHAGYLLVGVIGALEKGEAGVRGVLFYLFVYGLTTLGAFGVVVALEHFGGRHDDQQVQRYNGVGYAHPALGLAFVVFMFALAGIPPTAGFQGKVLLFAPALDAGHVALVVIAVLNSVASVYYYLRLVVYMWMKPAPSSPHALAQRPAVSSPWLSGAIALTSILLIMVGTMPDAWLQPLAKLL
jgi:NADH-quinone oxidoreductase subunit N